ncbi:hypothetical protein LTR37_021571 [Vermiconidia calcicola]|uniref:Uncharacterized protein n=1 Tax=Vermiconidia calcicola TaxID=1690605 RepID=A0ACC3MA04_9PEZI|nr:hypothetical protein LTR37_021571 [Vermiconidia calcicola]
MATGTGPMDNFTGKRHDATGRSTGTVRHFGGTAKKWKFDEAFVCEPMSLLQSPGYRALNFPALRILAFLKLEHLRHGGAENGLLQAPYRQLELLGISSRNVHPALRMLEVMGFIRLTSDGTRLGGRPNAATYALTWLPTCDGRPPTEDYKRISGAHIKAYKAEKKAEVSRARETIAACPKEGGMPALGKAHQAKDADRAFLKEGDPASLREGTLYILGSSRGPNGSTLEPGRVRA